MCAALFPLTIRQTKNMRAVQELKPEMDEIRCRYKDDRQKQQEAIMDLYRKRRINLLAHFLPILVQVPVFITMYQVVRNHEETSPSFATGGLLWFTDLTFVEPLGFPGCRKLLTPLARRGVVTILDNQRRG